MRANLKKGRRTYEERSRRSGKHLRPKLGATCGRLLRYFHPNRVELRTHERRNRAGRRRSTPGQKFVQLRILGEEGAEHIDGRASLVVDEVGCMGYVPRGFQWTLWHKTKECWV